MADTYPQELKRLAKTFRELNIQLLGFLLVAIGFIFTSDTVMTNPDLYWVTSGLSFTFILWVVSLTQFFGIEFHRKEGKSLHEALFRTLRAGNVGFGLGLMTLSGSLTYLTVYIAFFFQTEGLFYKPLAMFLIILTAAIAFSGVGWFYFQSIKTPRPMESNK